MTETQTILKAEELRLGNWVKIVNPIRVTALLLSDFGQWMREMPMAYPIPLTPEILEKAGFEKDKWGHKYTIDICDPGDGQKLVVDVDGGWYMYYGDPNYGPTGRSYVIHVHQLQNLYFALTGVELQIEL